MIIIYYNNIMSQINKFIAEFLGTFFFLGVILLTNGNALAIGLSLAIVVYLISKISGGHVNPAISIMMYAKGDLTMSMLVFYIIAQILGGLSALYAYKKALKFN